MNALAAALTVAALFVIGMFGMPDPDLVATLPPGTTAPVATTAPPAVTIPAGGATTTVVAVAPPPTLPPPRAERLLNAEQVTDTIPPPFVVPDWARCPQWWEAAHAAGFAAHELWHVDRIVYAESRCNESAFNGSGGDQSYGLMQINVKASSGNRSLVGPWVDWDWSRLLDAETNLRVGRMMADYVEDELGWCRWRPWTTRDRSVCG